MNKSLVYSTLAAATLALALGACDQQQQSSESESSAVPMQQGAVPQENATENATPMAPESSEPMAAQPEGTESETMEPEAEQPAGTSQ